MSQLEAVRALHNHIAIEVLGRLAGIAESWAQALAAEIADDLAETATGCRWCEIGPHGALAEAMRLLSQWDQRSAAA